MEGPIPNCAFPERPQQPSPEPHYIYLAREKLNAGSSFSYHPQNLARLRQLEAFNQINVGVHSATRPDDQGRQLVLVSSRRRRLFTLGACCRWRPSQKRLGGNLLSISLHSAFAADLVAADDLAHASDANCFAGSGFLPAETRWPWWADIFLSGSSEP